MVATELLAASRQLLIVRPHACRADCPPDAADPDGVCMEQANRAICDVHWQYWEPCFPCNIQHHEPEHPTVWSRSVPQNLAPVRLLPNV